MYIYVNIFLRLISHFSHTHAGMLLAKAASSRRTPNSLRSKAFACGAVYVYAPYATTKLMRQYQVKAFRTKCEVFLHLHPRSTTTISP